MSNRPRGRSGVRNNKPIEKPLTKREIRVFFVRMALLCAGIAGVYWLGWRSPWARADATVHVETPDAPKAPVSEPVSPAVTAPPAGATPDAPEVKPAKQTETKTKPGKEDKPQEEDAGKARKRSRHKRAQTDDSAPAVSEVKPDRQTETNPEADKEQNPQEDSSKSKKRTRHKRTQTDD